MKFLIDNALPQRLAAMLRGYGHDAVHIREYGLQREVDLILLQRASEEERTLISADTDFGTLLALRNAVRPSFILFREPKLATAEDYLGALLPALPSLEPDLLRGSVVVFRSGRIRIRNLPLAQT